ncbi:hypothetical protein [Streptomyces sp. NPDC090026]|uniref:hypothetical protein n=1 Tax=Streptomyces sp. NPDC090026 TaxID=3365923 RepID=UPI00380F46E9
MPTTEQTMPLQPAPYGYGVSSMEGGVLLHTLVTEWEAPYEGYDDLAKLLDDLVAAAQAADNAAALALA